MRAAVSTTRSSRTCAGDPPLELAGSDLFVHVRQGRLDVGIGDSSVHLGEGDSLQATRPRQVSWSVPADERSVSLWVTTRPEAASP